MLLVVDATILLLLLCCFAVHHALGERPHQVEGQHKKTHGEPGRHHSVLNSEPCELLQTQHVLLHHLLEKAFALSEVLLHARVRVHHQLVLHEALRVPAIQECLDVVLGPFCVDRHHVVLRLLNVNDFGQLADTKVLADLVLVLVLAIDLSFGRVVSLDPHEFFASIRADVTVVHR